MLGTLAVVCGIVAVLGRRDDRLALEAAAVVPLLRDATALLGVAAGPDVTTADDGERDLALDLEAAAALLRVADDALRSLPGVRLLVEDAKCVLEIDAVLATLAAHIVDLDSAVDSSDVSVTRSNEPDSPLDAAGARVERINAALGELADHTFALRRDRLRMAREIIGLWGGTPPPTAVGGLWSIQVALSALDRLEVRGRDSAGLQVFVRGADLDTAINDGDSLSQRLADPLFGSGAVRATDNGLAFVYKTAAEIGELGDNTAALRAAIRDDSLLRWALSYDEAETIVLSHTRWASIGIVSEPNTHPLDAWPSPRDGADVAASPRDGAHVAAVLNGDVDNYADLLAQRRLSIAPEITTDAKVIPTMLRQALAASKRADSNATTAERLRLAFVDTVSTFDGSVAIAAHASDLPGSVALALRGSGQALYVGATDHAYVIASEPYGLVEECRRFVRLDGETPSNPANPVGSRGQVMLVSAPSVADDGAGAGPLVALQRFSYDGSELPLRHDDVVTAEITTRDIDRGDSPHFLLKEIREAPDSLRAPHCVAALRHPHCVAALRHPHCVAA